MDQVVAQALTLYAKLSNMNRVEAREPVCEPELPTVTFPMEVETKTPFPAGLAATRSERSVSAPFHLRNCRNYFLHGAWTSRRNRSASLLSGAPELFGGGGRVLDLSTHGPACG